MNCPRPLSREKGNELNISRTSQKVQVVFTGIQTADSYIEGEVFASCEQGTRQVWAITSDMAQSNFSAAKGAHVMSSSLFVEELKKAKRESRERMQAQGRNSHGTQMLIETVDVETRAALYRLRETLSGQQN